MSEHVDLNLIGQMLHRIQADQRTLRSEFDLLRRQVGDSAARAAPRDELMSVVHVLSDRVANFEASVEAGLASLRQDLNEVSTSINDLSASNRRIEATLAALLNR